MAPAGSAERNEGKAKAAPAGSAERNEGKAKAAPAGSAERNEGKAKAAPAGSAERKANDDSSYYYDDSDSDNAGANAEEEKKPAASVAKAGAGAIKPPAPAPARDGQDHEDGDGLRSKRAVTHLFLCEVKQSQQACGIRSESPDHKASKSYLKDLTIKLWNSQCWSLIKILKPGLNIFGRFATTSPACTGL